MPRPDSASLSSWLFQKMAAFPASVFPRTISVSFEKNSCALRIGLAFWAVGSIALPLFSRLVGAAGPQSFPPKRLPPPCPQLAWPGSPDDASVHFQTRRPVSNFPSGPQDLPPSPARSCFPVPAPVFPPSESSRERVRFFPLFSPAFSYLPFSPPISWKPGYPSTSPPFGSCPPSCSFIRHLFSY